MKEKNNSGLTTLTIYNVAFVVSDVDKAVAWYADALGFKLLAQETIPGTKGTLKRAFLEGAGIKLEILQNSENQYVESIEKDARTEAAPSVIGSKAIVFKVEDLKLTTQELAQKGVDFLWKDRYLAEDRLFSTMILDPDGNRINIFQSNTVA
tara:strand:+ start:1258 stop:1713 length:456 start_codon:yes stop_codon:yes gene_type:complete